MIILNCENRVIKISSDQDFSIDIRKQNKKYNHIYTLSNSVNGEDFATKYSIVIEDQNNQMIDNAIVIADNAGIASPQMDSAVIKDDAIILVIGMYIVALDINTLSMLWFLTTENCYACFSIHSVGNRFIAYCEGSIIGIRRDGSLEWEFTGRDIFVSVNGFTPFELNDEWIDLVDFENNKYRIGFDGSIIQG